jgi:hypothetical protein
MLIKPVRGFVDANAYATIKGFEVMRAHAKDRPRHGACSQVSWGGAPG